jgi:hypothetical protein
MGEPVYLQYPFVGGLDQKTADMYLSAESNQSAISNGNFRDIGTINKRNGIHYDAALGTASLINAGTISDAYLAPSRNVTALAGFGSAVFQSAWGWNLSGTVESFIGGMPAATPTRRPLPIQGNQVPMIVDTVTSSFGTVNVAAWLNTTSPGAGSGTGNGVVNAALLNPDTGEGLFALPPLNITADDVQMVRLLYFSSTPAVALFLAIRATGGATRSLFCYTFDPTSSSAMVWTLRAGATLAMDNTSLGELTDVQLFHGDPSSGYIVAYHSALTTMSYAYYQSFALVSTGVVSSPLVAVSGPMFIQADWGTDVVFVWTDNISLYLHYFSGDGLFTSLLSGTPYAVAMNTINAFFGVANQMSGICRMYTPWLSPSPPANFQSQIYVAFSCADTNYSGQVVTIGGFLNRTGTGIPYTVSYSNFTLYPAAMQPIGRPAQPTDGMANSTYYVHVVHPCLQAWQASYLVTTSLQCTEYLCDFRIGPGASAVAEVTVIATSAPRQVDRYISTWLYAGGAVNAAPCLSADGTQIYTPILTSASGTSANSKDVGTQWLVTFELASVETPTVVPINNTNEVRGGMPMRLYSSGRGGASSLSEHGFIHYPEAIYTAFTGTGLTGTYSYAVCYLRQDANGNIERSSPAVLATPVSPANQKVVVTFPKLSWWANKQSNPQGYTVEIYRTLASGNIYYCVARLGTLDFAASSSQFWASYTDSTTDAALQTSEILYTTGGLLDNVNPPAARLHCAHRGRYAVVDETLRSVWFTKAETQGEVLGFNEVLVQPFIEGGDITALASLDDKFIVFKKDSIWIQYGDGPADNGQNSDWTQPQLIPTDVGCIASVSVSTAPAGVVFQAASGFHLLGRDLNVIYVGKAVQDTVDLYPTCITSVAVPSAKQIRWCMQAEGGAQIILVYDYFLNQWTTHSYTHLDSAIVDLYLVNDVYTVLTTKGTRYTEASNYLDTDTASASYFVPLSITSPWIKVSGQQGYQRARRVLGLGIANDPSGIKMDLAFNYKSTVRQTKTKTYAQLAGDSQISTHVAAQWNKCQALQVTLTDVDDASKSTGQGMSFGAIGLDMDKIGDYYRRLPARLKG